MEDAHFIAGVLHVDALKGSVTLSAQIWIQ
jgi:hypothetical protein